MLEKAEKIKGKLVEWRREFHSHPELGFREEHTSSFVADSLEGMGYRVRRNVGRTGVVADIGSGAPVLAFRADMDALPIQEANRVPYASKNPGIMHACGHDAHTAIALGTAELITGEKLPGTVRFLFQHQFTHSPSRFPCIPRIPWFTPSRQPCCPKLDLTATSHVVQGR